MGRNLADASGHENGGGLADAMRDEGGGPIVTRSVSEAGRENWWAERGSIRYLWDESSLHAAIEYVMDGQDRFPR
jgi:hypothetical protein